jgi:hypothetical protein
MRDMWRDALPEATASVLFFLPWQRRRSIERWLRGREEYRKLQLADYVLMSWGKSGRTWLRVMLSRFYQVKYALPQQHLLGFDNLHRMNAGIPRILFSHNNYLRDYTKNWHSKAHFRGKKIVILVRDPRDVAVSQFFQWKYRMRPSKMRLNDYPAYGEEISLFDFVMKPQVGIPRIIDFFNGWAEAMPELKDMRVVRYEDVRADPKDALQKILEFMGTPGSDTQIQEAVDFAAYDNMKKLEEEKVFRRSGARVVPGDRKNPNSYKVRRAKIGGYRDYFDDPQIAKIDALVNSKLSPSFGYADPMPSVRTRDDGEPGDKQGDSSAAVF